jgi:hypothetical protein
MTLKLFTRKENIILWQMQFQAKKKKQRVQYMLFLFRSPIGWNKDRTEARERGMQYH